MFLFFLISVVFSRILRLKDTQGGEWKHGADWFLRFRLIFVYNSVLLW